MPKKLTQEQFIQKAQQIHDDKYDYSKVEYINSASKVCIVCPEHGEFWQMPYNHIHNRNGCPNCIIRKSKYSNKQELSKILSDIYGNEYKFNFGNDFRVSSYINCFCYKHGEFRQQIRYLLNGISCKKCLSDKKRMSLEEWIQKAQQIHDDKYDYSKSVYTNCRTSICIICPEHGEFWQEAGSHLDGCGCKLCRASKGEIKIKEFLDLNNIKYYNEYKFENCINPKTNKVLRFDFYLPDYNMCIEFNGIQHYKPYSFGSDKSEEAKILNLKELQYRDNLKEEYCKNNNIKLLKVPYLYIKNINCILELKIYGK